MKEKDKIFIKKLVTMRNIMNWILKNLKFFLRNLQEFIVNIGLAKVSKGEYEFDGKSYDMETYYTLFYEDPKDDFQTKKLTIDNFGEGEIVRYFNKEIELLIIFLQKQN